VIILNSNDTNSTTEHSLDDTADFEEDIVDNEDDGMFDEDTEYMERLRMQTMICSIR